MFGSAGAYAQDFSAAVSPNPLTLPPGTLPVADQAFDVTVSNLNLTTPETFDSDALGALPPTVNIVDDAIATYLSSNGPVTLAPGGSIVFGPGGVAADGFDLSIGAGTDNFVGDLTVQSSTGDADNPAGCGPGNSGNAGCPDALSTYIAAGNQYGNFQVNTVPEPAGVSLLMSGLFSGGLLLRARRK
jgi:hypothetical protein